MARLTYNVLSHYQTKSKIKRGTITQIIIIEYRQKNGYRQKVTITYKLIIKLYKKFQDISVSVRSTIDRSNNT